MEVGLEDRLQHQHQARLDHPIGNRGYPELRSFPGPTGLGILRSWTGKGRTCPTSPRPQIIQEIREPARSTWPRSATVNPSMPADRAPRFPATRANAMLRIAGSCTRLNRSSNRGAVGPRPTVKFGLHLRYPPAWTRRTAARDGAAFAGASFGIAASVPSRSRCRPSPCDRLSRPRSTTAAPPPRPVGGRRAQPARLAGCGPGGTRPGRFPCSLLFARRRRRPALSLRPRHRYAADLPRDLPGTANETRPEVPAASVTSGTHRARPISARFEPVQT